MACRYKEETEFYRFTPPEPDKDPHSSTKHIYQQKYNERRRIPNYEEEKKRHLQKMYPNERLHRKGC